MATAVEAPQTQFLMLDLAKITPSPMNPRKRFDDKALKELAESILAHGVQQPIVVRPNGKEAHYEIVVGERRFRASKLAGAKQIPAIVRELNDAAALEIMVIENLQRADVHPLDEALGYEALMKKYVGCPSCHTLGTTPDSHSDGCPDRDKPPRPATADSIATKVGKSTGYVYARLKLLALVSSARKAFEKDEITAGHAVLIARLQPDDQERALKACFDSGYYGNGKGPLIAEKQLRKWLQENIQLNLDKAPFDITDAKLVPSAGACTSCPKRSGTNPALFEGMELGKNTCIDPTCYQTKKAALVHINLAKVEKEKGETPIPVSHYYNPGNRKREKGVLYQDSYRDEYYQNGKRQAIKKDECEHTKLAVYIDGEEDYSSNSEIDSGKDAGKAIYVCTGRGKCKVHEDRYHSSSGPSDAAARRNQRIARHFTVAMFQAVVGKALKLTRADRELIAFEFFGKLGHYTETPMIATLGWNKKLGAWDGKNALRKHFAEMSDAALDACLLYFAIAPDLNARTPSEPKDLIAVAKRHKVNVDTLLKAAKEKFSKKAGKAKAKGKAASAK